VRILPARLLDAFLLSRDAIDFTTLSQHLERERE